MPENTISLCLWFRLLDFAACCTRRFLIRSVLLQAHNRFDSLMETNKIHIRKVESFADDPSSAIQNLKVSDRARARVCVCVCVCM